MQRVVYCYQRIDGTLVVILPSVPLLLLKVFQITGLIFNSVFMVVSAYLTNKTNL